MHENRKGGTLLDPTSLKQAAVYKVGWANFGSAPMDEGLERLVWSLGNEADLTVKQLDSARDMIVGTLAHRLKIENFLAQNPIVLDEVIRAPLFVISLPRTGSTATSQFLAEDPNARSLRRWESQDVIPPPDVRDGDADPRIAKMQAQFEELYRQQPERRGMLPVDAQDPSEHGPLLALTFQNLQMPSLFNIPTYAKWAIGSDLRPAYAYLKKVLQVLQWTTPAPHWNLKNPPDIFGLSALAKVFPDARLLWIHRDPCKSIPSVCSLTAMVRTNLGEMVDRSAMGAMQTDFQSTGAQIAMAAEDALTTNRIVHVFQRDLVGDTVGTIEAIYRKLGLEFSEAYRAHLSARVKSREKPSHSYRMEDFGLDVTSIRHKFMFYTDRYSVPLEL
jgi:hypothetical protein